MAVSVLGRRLRAARQLRGYTNREQLADAIGERGLGADRLRDIEQGKGPAPERRDLAAIAAACDLPVEFFTADLREALRDAPERPQLQRIETALGKLNERLSRIEATLAGGDPKQVREVVGEFLAATRAPADPSPVDATPAPPRRPAGAAGRRR